MQENLNINIKNGSSFVHSLAINNPRGNLDSFFVMNDWTLLKRPTIDAVFDVFAASGMNFNWKEFRNQFSVHPNC